jgi:indolepyruvate ferredoxin oxidoreductase
MAYKDEYEVARLHVDPVFTGKIAEMFEGNFRLVHHLAPPLFARKNDRGELIKQPFGQWMRGAFHILARLKGLRGTPFDPFGYTVERREERALIVEYRRCIEELLQSVSKKNLAAALEIARLPEEIRGYGHVKARNLAQVRARRQTLMLKWRLGDAKEQETEPARVPALA